MSFAADWGRKKFSELKGELTKALLKNSSKSSSLQMPWEEKGDSRPSSAATSRSNDDVSPPAKVVGQPLTVRVDMRVDTLGGASRRLEAKGNSRRSCVTCAVQGP